MKHRYLKGPELLRALRLKPNSYVLFVHAHPDDETIATGHAIKRLSDNGVHVYVAIATDGELSTLGDPALVQAGYRRIEATLALDRLGVPFSNQRYFGLADGQLGSSDEQAELADQIWNLLAKRTFAAIFTPGEHGFDGHPDHIAVHQAAMLAVKEMVTRPMIWSLDSSIGDVSVAPDAQTKLLAAAYHETQYPDVPAAVAEGNLKPYSELIFSGEHYQDNTLY